MSDNNGLLVSDEGGVYFVPADELAKFKLSDEAAASLGDIGDEVSGFARRPELKAMSSAKFAFVGSFKPAVLDAQYSDNPIASIK